MAQHSEKSGTEAHTTKRQNGKQFSIKKSSDVALVENMHQIVHCMEPDLSFSEGIDEEVTDEPLEESNNRLNREEAADILGRMAEYETNFKLENLFHSETIILALKKRKHFDKSHSLRQIEFGHRIKYFHTVDKKTCDDQMVMSTNDKNGWIIDLLLQRKQRRLEEPIARNNCDSRVQRNLFLTIQPKKHEFKLLFKQNSEY